MVKTAATFALTVPFGLNDAAATTFLALFAQMVVLRPTVTRHHAPVRVAWPMVAPIVAAVAGRAVSILASQESAQRVARFAFSCCCLVPLFLGLRRLQTA